jgi:hypothetical protein
MNLQATLKKQEKTLATYNKCIVLYLLVSYKHLTTLKHTNYIQRRRMIPFSKEEVLNQRKKMTHNPKKKHNSRSCK